MPPSKYTALPPHLINTTSTPASSASASRPFTTSSSSSLSLSSSLPTLGTSFQKSDDRLPNQESLPLFQPDSGSQRTNTVNTFVSSSSSSSSLSSSSTSHANRSSPTFLQTTKMMEIQNPVAAPVSIPIKPSALPPSLLNFGKRKSASTRELSRASRSSKENSTPSVAALKVLAATSIPLRPSAPKYIVNGTRQRPRLPQRKSSDASPTSLESPSSLLDFVLSDALDEKLSLPITRSNSQTFLNVLLSPPDLSDDYSVAISPPRSALSIRSLSTESIPSLANDDEGTFSWGAPVTPSPLRRSSKLSKTFSPPEECILDHPLLAAESQEQSSDEDVDPASLYTEQEKKLGAFRLSFKSNLTASLRVLRSAARTFTSLSTPLTQPDDFLTRSILSISPQYNTDEKRPKFNDVPTPALRRYLNPSPKTFSRELGQFTDRNESVSASIQLETYKHTIITPPPEVPVTRNREVRENSDFLRVIVLEMNMRRQGKLSDTSQGKARFVLPPRQSSKLRPLGDSTHWKPINFD
ncbi:hypothetical protein EYR41_000884 [Orbilia oligospora]|uniref:Uncharacterized protein n=1 Tax=Orbilia oligospora TaxID=2813651 RepID=A0A7C8KHN0_ORBOL|nr:hypothetical protein TWF751_005625 [Orbilia oligospora]TGJ73810.1 hypothetical protein EYR41_000884 [Orbilia oligospora]